MKFQETKQSTIKIEHNKYSLFLMNNKKYNIDSKVTQKDSISDKNKKKTRQTTTEAFIPPACNKQRYLCQIRNKSRLYILDVQDWYNKSQKIYL